MLQNEIVAAHHAVVAAVQERVLLGTSVHQALTKRRWDAARQPVRFRVDEYVIVLMVAPNRLLPWYVGPFKVTRVSEDGNFVNGVASRVALSSD